MPLAKQKTTRKASKKKASSVAVTVNTISAKDTLFPRKVAKARKALRGTTFCDPRFGFNV